MFALIQLTNDQFIVVNASQIDNYSWSVIYTMSKDKASLEAEAKRRNS
jgi:hypothetical protein